MVPSNESRAIATNPMIAVIFICAPAAKSRPDTKKDQHFDVAEYLARI